MPFEVTPISAAPSAKHADDAAEEAYALALRILGSRAIASGRLRERLIAREIDRDLAEEAVQRVIDNGYLDDRAFAADAVERLRQRKQLGDRALKQELMKLGVSSTDADEALREAPADDPFALALDAARARAARLGGLDRETAERRLMGYLQRRGHGGAVAARAVQEALDGAGSARRRVEFR